MEIPGRDSSRCSSPRIHGLDCGIAKHSCISRHKDRTAGSCSCSCEKQIRNMIIKCLYLPTLQFQDCCTCLSFCQSPGDDSAFKQLVDSIPELFGQIPPLHSGIKTADAIRYLPGGDGCGTEVVFGNGIQEGGNSQLGQRPYHLGIEVRVYQPCTRSIIHRLLR